MTRQEMLDKAQALIDEGNFEEAEISTHTLTWSVTERADKKITAQAFQLTRSRGA